VHCAVVSLAAKESRDAVRKGKFKDLSMGVARRNSGGDDRAQRRLGWPGTALLALAFAVPLFVLVAWLNHMVALRVGVPTYVVRLTLPDGTSPIGLPPVEGPADASRPLVVIDAGHGGHDPGASGAGGDHEKTLTLALALAIRDALLADGRVRVALTRSDDRFLVLQERAGIARRLHADLFLSIHADAVDGAGASGATVYTLSDKGSGALADALAARENRVDTINGVALGGKDDAVSQFLVDLSQQRMRTSSQAFAGLILREGQGHFRFRDTPLQQAAFVVLKSVDVPSVLLEAGYISSPDDVREMRSRDWRNGFGRAVAGAIEIFLARQAVPADPGVGL
jgi:N-acetylmuramoyl-L-alanine amidase